MKFTINPPRKPALALAKSALYSHSMTRADGTTAPMSDAQKRDWASRVATTRNGKPARYCYLDLSATPYAWTCVSW